VRPARPVLCALSFVHCVAAMLTRLPPPPHPLALALCVPLCSDLGEVNTILTANITIASAAGFPGAPEGSRAREHAVPLGDAVAEMVDNVDVIYMHIDGDVMDESLVPVRLPPAACRALWLQIPGFRHCSRAKRVRVRCRPPPFAVYSPCVVCGVQYRPLCRCAYTAQRAAD
jgi:hypothetical protein